MRNLVLPIVHLGGKKGSRCVCGGVFTRHLEVQDPAGKWFPPASALGFCDDRGEKLGLEL